MALKIHLEGFVGDDINQVLSEGCEAAARLRLHVTMDINGIHVLIKPNDSAADIQTSYRDAVDRNVSFASANMPRPSAALREAGHE